MGVWVCHVWGGEKVYGCVGRPCVGVWVGYVRVKSECTGVWVSYVWVVEALCTPRGDAQATFLSDPANRCCYLLVVAFRC